MRFPLSSTEIVRVTVVLFLSVFTSQAVSDENAFSDKIYEYIQSTASLKVLPKGNIKYICDLSKFVDFSDLELSRLGLDIEYSERSVFLGKTYERITLSRTENFFWTRSLTIRKNDNDCIATIRLYGP